MVNKVGNMIGSLKNKKILKGGLIALATFAALGTGTIIKNQLTVNSNSSLAYSYVTLSEPDGNGAYFTNKNIPFSTDADPYMIKSGDTYYVYTTGNKYYTSTDLKTWSSAKTALTSGKPSDVNYMWAPEVYKIGDTYYLFQSYIIWGDGYPFNKTSNGYVGVATTKDLSSGFTYYKTLNVNLNNLGDATIHTEGGEHRNLNFIDGTLLMEGNNVKTINGHYFFYFKAEFDQNIYVMELDSNFNPTDNTPTKVITKTSSEVDGWGNDVAEAPQVWYHDGYYSMMYSSGDYKGQSGSNEKNYAVGYAWASSPKGSWTNQSIEGNKKTFFSGVNTYSGSAFSVGDYSVTNSIYAPGHNALFVSNDGNWYNVYHSAYYSSNNFAGRKVNIQRMGVSQNGKVYSNAASTDAQPLISGTKYSGNTYSIENKVTMNVSDTQQKILTDGAIVGASSSDAGYSAQTVNSISELTLTFNGRYNISDIWLSGAGISSKDVDVYINEDAGKPYKVSGISLNSCVGSNSYKKLQLPDISKIEGGIKKVRIVFDSSVNLTEVTPIRVNDTEYTEKTYVSTFYSDGNVVSTINKTYGNTIGTLPTVTKSGYTFGGWYTAQTGGTKISSTTTVEESKNYYAQWTPNTYKVTYNAVGGTLSETGKTVQYDSAYGTLPTPTKTGYTFAGWYTKETGGTEVTANTKVEIASNQTIYAHWSANKYTLTYDAGEGSVAEKSKTITYGSAYGDLQTPTRDGYVFGGWYTEKTGGTEVTSTTKVTSTSNQTIYARWGRGTYKITYDAVGGTVSETSKTVKYNETYGTLQTPVRTGYTFNGWYTDKTGGTEITSNTKVLLSDDQTIYAHWTVGTYTLTYDAVGGTLSETSKTVQYDSTYGELPTPTKERHIFKGWYTEKTCGTEITADTKVTVVTNQTIYAHWQKMGDNEYILNFDANSGTVSEKNRIITKGNTYGDLPTPIKKNYTFKGWYTDKTEGTEITSNTKVEMASDQTIYARWAANQYTVTYDVNGGTVNETSKTVEYDSTYGELPAPKRTGYIFQGWYTEKIGGTKINNDTKVELTNDQTLYAHWTTGQYTITYDAGEGTLNETSKTVIYNEMYGELPVPKRTGYIFKGWYTAKTDGKPVKATDKVTITEDQTIYAKWEEIPANKIAYIIYYKQMTVDGKDYTIVNTDTGYADESATIKGDLKEYKGFKTPEEKSITISTEEDKNVLVYEYTRNMYNIKYSDNRQEKAYYGAKIELNYQDRTGYQFTGFAATSGTIEGNILTVEGETEVSEIWTPINYKIIYNLDGGTLENQINTYNIESGLIEIGIPTRTGYVFLGWKEENDETLKPKITINTGSTGNKEYTAVWQIDDGTVQGIENPKTNVTLPIIGSIIVVSIGATLIYRIKRKNKTYKL